MLRFRTAFPRWERAAVRGSGGQRPITKPGYGSYGVRGIRPGRRRSCALRRGSLSALSPGRGSRIRGSDHCGYPSSWLECIVRRASTACRRPCGRQLHGRAHHPRPRQARNLDGHPSCPATLTDPRQTGIQAHRRALSPSPVCGRPVVSASRVTRDGPTASLLAGRPVSSRTGRPASSRTDPPATSLPVRPASSRTDPPVPCRRTPRTGPRVPDADSGLRHGASPLRRVRARGKRRYGPRRDPVAVEAPDGRPDPHNSGRAWPWPRGPGRKFRILSCGPPSATARACAARKAPEPMTTRIRNRSRGLAPHGRGKLSQ
jgi:hypothetical protein